MFREKVSPRDISNLLDFRLKVHFHILHIVLYLSKPRVVFNISGLARHESEWSQNFIAQGTRSESESLSKVGSSKI